MKKSSTSIMAFPSPPKRREDMSDAEHQRDLIGPVNLEQHNLRRQSARLDLLAQVEKFVARRSSSQSPPQESQGVNRTVSETTTPRCPSSKSPPKKTRRGNGHSGLVPIDEDDNEAGRTAASHGDRDARKRFPKRERMSTSARYFRNVNASETDEKISVSCISHRIPAVSVKRWEYAAVFLGSLSIVIIIVLN
jgi:hypothetical protein